MKFLNQIYFYRKQTSYHSTLFLATVILVLSIFLNSNAAISAYHFTPANAVDSLPNKKSLKLSSQLPGDSLLQNDTSSILIADTVSLNDTVNIAYKSEIEDIITYKALDSIVYDMNTKKMYLYNGSDVQYQKIKLKANLVDFDWNTYTLTSQGTLDSTGTLQGNPVFEDDGKEYKAKKMKYNFKTKKGIVFEVLTKEGDAYIHSEAVKKNEYDEWYGLGSKYTTCDLDHLHFYF